jgi:hypothetical protein
MTFMDGDNIEVPLVGGTTNPVVRVGDTVRRHTGVWSAAVHALLLHLERAGYDAAPRFLGIDEQGREALTFIDGDVTADGPAPGQFTMEALSAAARNIRNYHDAIGNFDTPAGAQWRIQPGAPSAGSVICHNDLGPHNTIYRSGLPHFFIDWDFAAPGELLWDVVYAAWLFVPLFDKRRCRELGWPDEDRTKRLVAFCDAYRLEDRSDFVDVLLARQQVTHDLFVQWGTNGVTGFPRLLREGRDKGVIRDMQYARQNAGLWQSALQ